MDDKVRENLIGFSAFGKQVGLIETFVTAIIYDYSTLLIMFVFVIITLTLSSFFIN